MENIGADINNVVMGTSELVNDLGMHLVVPALLALGPVADYEKDRQENILLDPDHSRFHLINDLAYAVFYDIPVLHKFSREDMRNVSVEVALEDILKKKDFSLDDQSQRRTA